MQQCDLRVRCIALYICDAQSQCQTSPLWQLVVEESFDRQAMVVQLCMPMRLTNVVDTMLGVYAQDLHISLRRCGGGGLQRLTWLSPVLSLFTSSNVDVALVGHVSFLVS